jgi:hypothetical protein
MFLERCSFVPSVILDGDIDNDGARAHAALENVSFLTTASSRPLSDGRDGRAIM